MSIGGPTMTNPRNTDYLRSPWLNQFSINTAERYRRDLIQFASRLSRATGKADLLEAERSEIQNWIKHLRTRKHLTARNRDLRA